NFLPPHLLRRKKRGFAANVVDDWFRQAMKGSFEETLRDTSSEIYNLVKPAAVQQLLVSHQTGERDHHKLLFSLLVCEPLLRLSTAADAGTFAQGAGSPGNGRPVHLFDCGCG